MSQWGISINISEAEGSLDPCPFRVPSEGHSTRLLISPTRGIPVSLQYQERLSSSGEGLKSNQKRLVSPRVHNQNTSEHILQ